MLNRHYLTTIKKLIKLLPGVKFLLKIKELILYTPYYRKNFFSNEFQKLLTLTPTNISDIIFRFEPLLERSLKTKGCIVECGIGFGRSIQIITSLLSIKDPSRVVFGFDSFEGFPEFNRLDKTGIMQGVEGDWKYVKPHHIYEIIEKSIKGKHAVKTFIYKGYFEDTLNDKVISEIKEFGGISFLHLDVDLYDSYLCTLSRLWELVNPGGVILFDEYHKSSLKKWPGSKKAIDLFLIEKQINPENSIKTDQTGRCFLIKK